MAAPVPGFGQVSMPARESMAGRLPSRVISAGHARRARCADLEATDAGAGMLAQVGGCIVRQGASRSAIADR